MSVPSVHCEARACANCGAILIMRAGEGRAKFRRRRYCSKHCACSVAARTSRLNRPPLTAAEILEDHTGLNEETGCTEWTGAKNTDGYGTTSIKTHRGAHRLAYAILVGPIPGGMHVLHRCDNPACITPAHLFLGTHAENMADKARKRRQHRMLGERNGRARLTECQVKEILSSPISGAALGRKFGVSRAAVNDIRRGTKWRHVTP